MLIPERWRLRALDLQCREFKADTGDVLTLSDDSTIPEPDPDAQLGFTFAAIAKPENTADEMGILERWTVGNGGGIMLRWDYTAARAEVFLHGFSPQQLASNSWAQDEWGVVFASAAEGVQRLSSYRFDGRLQDESEQSANSVIDPFLPWTIGARDNGSDDADGQIGLVCYFHGVQFSAEEEQRFVLYPHEICEKYWHYAEFIVCPATGIDCGPHARHFAVTESTSVPGLFPPMRLRQKRKLRPAAPAGGGSQTATANLATATATAQQATAVPGVVTETANLATCTASAFQAAASTGIIATANLATCTASAQQATATPGTVVGSANLATTTASAFQATAQLSGTAQANPATCTASAFQASATVQGVVQANLAIATASAQQGTATPGTVTITANLATATASGFSVQEPPTIREVSGTVSLTPSVSGTVSKSESVSGTVSLSL